MSAAEDLTRALLRMAESGERPRCGDGEISLMFTSDDPESRRLAATYCRSCPLTELCWSYAVETNATAAIYAGRDTADPVVQKAIRAARRTMRKPAAS